MSGTLCQADVTATAWSNPTASYPRSRDRFDPSLTRTRGSHYYRVDWSGAVAEEKEEVLSRGQTLISYNEWEDFGQRWKIDTLESSGSLPQGAEKAEVWRNEIYEHKAKISGPIEGSRIDMHPKVEAGSLIPLFEIKG
jgi:hypothetical protein